MNTAVTQTSAVAGHPIDRFERWIPIDGSGNRARRANTERVVEHRLGGWILLEARGGRNARKDDEEKGAR